MDADVIAAAVDRLAHGGVVAFPTDTVYGLGALVSPNSLWLGAEAAAAPAELAISGNAIDRIYAMKRRPRERSLLVLVQNVYAMQHFVKDIPPYVDALADAFWPGPLTLVLPRKSWVPEGVTGGNDTIGVRVPNHPIPLELLRQLSERLELPAGLAAPSANCFGEPPPTTAEAVVKSLGAPDDTTPDTPDIVIDGGECPMRTPSTILRCVGPWPRLLRRGTITPEQIEAAIGRYVDR